MIVDHYPSVLQALCARLDHPPHLDQPRAYDQTSSRDYDVKLNTNQATYCDHDIDDPLAFRISIQRSDFDPVYATFSRVSIQLLDFDPSSTGQISIQRPGSNRSLTQCRPDKNTIADPPNHRYRLRARSSNTP